MTNSLSIISAATIIPMNEKLDASVPQTKHTEIQTLHQHALVIDQDRIIDILSLQDALQQYPQATHTHLPSHILMPGLINAHCHAGMTLLRGYADDKPLHEWLNDCIWPAEQQHLSQEFVSTSSKLAIAEMLLTGTTCFADMYFFPEITARICEEFGIRAQLSGPIFSNRTAWSTDSDEALEKSLALFDEYRHSPRVNFAFGPHAPYTVDDKTFKKIAMLAEEINAKIHLHLHETEQEVQDSLKTYGATPVARLHEIGLLGPDTQCVHMTTLSSEDTTTIKDSGAHIIHCPASNMKLTSGSCPVSRYLDNNIPVALGTDSAASNNTLNMFDSIRLCALLAKHTSQKAHSLSAAQALFMATLGGAKALGIDHLTGSLSIGKQADFIAIDTQTPAMQPLYSPTAQLVYSSPRVTDVWVAGRQLVKDQQLICTDINTIFTQTHNWQQKIHTAN